MRIFTRWTLLLLLLAGFSGLKAQVANDDCATALNLGTLPAPRACTGNPNAGQGNPVNFTGLTNVGAVPATPYTSMTGCQPTGNMASPASDVWYMVTLTGPELTVTINGAINNPNIGIWEGPCGALVGRGCARGTGGSVTATFTGLTPGVYYIQVSGGNVNDRGTFTMNLQNNQDCANCVRNSQLTASPPPINGTFQSGTTVTFCYEITEYFQANTNWLHGIVPTFGAGWDLTTLTGFAVPVSCDAAGTWSWYNAVTSTATGNTFGPGFFFDRNPTDGNPGNNFGANCTGTGAPLWRFCWTITTKPCPPGTQNQSLAIVINTLADGESGSWNNLGCTNDPDYLFSASLTCCEPPIIAQTNVLCFGGNNGSITATGQGTGSWNYVWRNGGGTVIRTQNNINGPDALTGLTAGNYSVTVTDNFDGCVTVTNITITQPPAVVVNITGQTNVTCNGLANGTATASGSGGTGVITYSWNTVPVQTGATASNLGPGTYTVTATDANGCTATANVTITQPTPVMVNITAQTNVTCNGLANGTATASGSGGTGVITYSWNTVPVQTGATATGLAAGTYTVTATDANGCTATANVTITQPTPVVVNITAQTNVTCNGLANGTATASGSGGTGVITYSWNTVPVQTGATATGLAAGTYTVTATDANGCTATANVTITQPTPVVVNITAQTNVTCNGLANGTATASGSGGTGVITYSWNTVPVQTNATATNLPAGTYTVTATDANGCTATANVTITQPTPVVVNITAQTNPLCAGGNTGSATASGSGGTGTITYSWNTVPVQTGATATGLTAGTYTVTATDANGCTATANVTLTDPPAIALTTSTVDATCGNPDGSATVNASGGAGGFSYSWNSTPVQTTATATNLPAGGYQVIVTDANGCTATANVTVNNQAAPTAAIVSQINVACAGGSNGSATASSSGGIGAVTFSWNTVPVQTGATATGLTAGTYTVTATDANGCSGSATVTITEPTPVIVSISAQTNVTCNGLTNGSATAAGSGGTGVITYSWNTVPVQTGATATNLGAGTYTVTATDSNGCTATANVTITEPTPLVVNITAQTNVTCGGLTDGSATAAGSGGTGVITYSWNTVPVQTGATATNLGAGTYTVTATDANGCTATANVTITEPTPVVANITAQTNVTCAGLTDGSATASASGGTGTITYSWNTIPVQTGATATNLGAGTYTVTATDANGCTATANVTITEPTAVVVNITASTDPLCAGGNTGSATASGSGGTGTITYSWNTVPVQTGATASGLVAGTYTVTATDANGCTATTTVTLTDPPAISLTTSTTDATCGNADGTATVNASGGAGGFSYSWNSVPVQTGATATNLPAGGYQVIVTDANGCTATANVTINNQAAPTANIVSQVDVACAGGATGSATASATGGVGTITYSWNTVPVQTGVTATALTAGTYTVTATDANGCSGSATVTITEPTPVVANITAQTNVTCAGLTDGTATATASGGTGTITYSWNTVPVQTGATATNLGAGTYTVTATDANGCTATANVTITEPTAVVVNITVSTDPLCAGGNTGSATASGSGGTGTITYSWNTVPVQTGATASGLVAGTYTVTATDANGCTATTTVTLTDPPAISLTTSTTDATCGNADGTATVNASGGAGGFSYSWNTVPVQTGATATNLPAGGYQVIVTDANGCTATANVTVNNQAAPTANIVSQVNVACAGGATGSATASATGGVGTITYSWNTVPVQTGATATGLTAGTYTVTATDANGCSGSATVTITEPTAVVAVIDSTHDASCNGLADGEAFASGSGGTGLLSFSWNSVPVQNTAAATGLGAGTYTVTVTDANGCTATATATVNEPAVLTVSISGSTDPLCAGSATGTATAAGSGGTPGYAYSWNTVPVQTGATATGLAAGSYTVVITDTNGCTANASVTLTDPAALSLSATTTDATCGNADGTATVTASGGTPGYTYSWNTTPVQTTPTATGLLAGNYQVVVTDLNGCQDSIPVVVNNSAAPVATIVSFEDVSCNGAGDGTATATATGGVGTVTFSWNTVPVQTGPNATNLGPGTYTVTATDSNGCTGSAQVVIAEPLLLTVAIDSAFDATCNGATNGSAYASSTGGTGAVNYAWNTVPVQNTPVATGLGAGMYTILVTDSNGCTAIDSVIINEPTPVVASITGSTDPLCFGSADGTATATGSGGTPGYTYNWSTVPAQTTAMATGLPAGFYSVTVTDSNGCQDSIGVALTDPAILALTGSSTPSTCGGADGTATVNATGGTGAYTYTWNTTPVQNTATASNLPAGTYTVVVVDSNGCLDSLTIAVQNLASPVAAIDSSMDVSCFGLGDGYAAGSGTGGTGPLSYSWNTVPAQTTPTATNLGPGTYTLTVTDSVGCQSVISATIAEPTLLVAAIDSSWNVNCFGDSSGYAFASASGGISPLSYIWNNNPAYNAPILGGVVAGTYEMVVTDSNGCTDTTSIIISEPPALFLTGNTSPATCGQADGQATVIATGGIPAYQYSWNTTPVQTTPTASGLSGGNYQVIVTDSNGCADSLVLPVSNLNSPVVSIQSSVDVSCNGENDGMANGVVTGGTAPFAYSWNTVPAQNNPAAINLGPGTFVLTVTDSAGCVATDTVQITQPDSLLGVLTSDSVSCFGLEDGSATVSITGGTPGYSIVWNSNPPLASATAAPLAAGTYTVLVTDANGCSFTDSVTVNEPLEVIAAFISSPTIPTTLDVSNATILFTNNSQNATTYTWDFGDGGTSQDINPTYTYDVVGDYCVLLTAMDNGGCQDTMQACFVRVINLDLIIPNTFTPNGDGTNDFFEIIGLTQYPNNRLEVYNRWGNLIYWKDQYDNDWNGSNIKSGELLPDGGYFYIFYPNKEDAENVAGDVVIFR